MFTSANGVGAFFDRGLAPAGRDARRAGRNTDRGDRSGDRTRPRSPRAPGRSRPRALRCRIVAGRLPGCTTRRRSGRDRASRAGARRAARRPARARIPRRRAARLPHGAGGSRSRPARPRAGGRGRRPHVHVVVDRHQPVRSRGCGARPAAARGLDRTGDLGHRPRAGCGSTPRPTPTPSTPSSSRCRTRWRRGATDQPSRRASRSAAGRPGRRRWITSSATCTSRSAVVASCPTRLARSSASLVLSPRSRLTARF